MLCICAKLVVQLLPPHTCTAGLLTPEETAWVLAQRHRPLAVGQALSTILQAVDADSIVKTRIDRLISTYTYEFGGCNRIYNTAIPSAYTRYLA
jgi:predicted membrane chloride channel (bestrophin family)